LLLISLFVSQISDTPEVTFHEVPVFKLNFYLMGKETVDQEITVQIGKNVDYLNQEFEGRIKFELGQLMMDPNHSFIPDLHKDHVSKDRSRVDELIDPIEIAGAINIYLFETYSTNEGHSAMLGFTPVLKAQFNKYEMMTPQFDRLFISYLGILDQSTIIHEMGHFLGLSHPWEMSHVDLDMMGLYGAEAERNHMSYHPEVNHFSWQQLERMQHFALNFRSYLVDRVERRYISDQAFVKERTFQSE
jgi:hypothetical protein